MAVLFLNGTQLDMVVYFRTEEVFAKSKSWQILNDREERVLQFGCVEIMRREPKEELVKKCQSIPGGSDTSDLHKAIFLSL
jgi:hypothetical protein